MKLAGFGGEQKVMERLQTGEPRKKNTAPHRHALGSLVPWNGAAHSMGLGPLNVLCNGIVAAQFHGSGPLIPWNGAAQFHGMELLNSMEWSRSFHGIVAAQFHGIGPLNRVMGRQHTATGTRSRHHAIAKPMGNPSREWHTDFVVSRHGYSVE